jgi:hypothetical protein
VRLGSCAVIESVMIGEDTLLKCSGVPLERLALLYFAALLSKS